MKQLLMAALLMTALMTPAIAGELVVVEAHGIKLAPGQVVDDQKVLVLKEGQQVTLLAASGATLKLRGPYSGPPSGGGGGNGPDVMQGVATLLAQAGTRTSDVGIVRANVLKVDLPDPWLVYAEHDGNACVRQGMPVVFWRSNATEPAKVRVMPIDRSWMISMTWPAGSDRLLAPRYVVVQQRSSYLVDVNGRRSAITLNDIPSVVGTNQMRLAWMRQKSCDVQAAALLHSFH